MKSSQGNQLLDGSISLSPLYPNLMIVLRLNFFPTPTLSHVWYLNFVYIGLVQNGFDLLHTIVTWLPWRLATDDSTGADHGVILLKLSK